MIFTLHQYPDNTVAPATQGFMIVQQNTLKQQELLGHYSAVWPGFSEDVSLLYVICWGG